MEIGSQNSIAEATFGEKTREMLDSFVDNYGNRKVRN